MNAIMQISEGIITIGFVLAFIIICKRKRIHRNAFKRIAIVLLLSFIAFIIVQAIPPLTDTIKLEALGEKNEASSSDEILVHAYHIDNKEYKVKSATVGEWLWLDYYGWINANDERCPDGITQSIELQVPVGVSRGISFVSGPFCGMVSMETVDGNTYTIDTYCAEEGFLSCNIGRSNWKLLLLNCIIRIAVFISIMCVMIWHLIRVLVKCNSDIASTQTGWGKNQKKYALAAIALFITIIMTRSFCLMHEMENHPDEHVFIAASESLADVFLNPSHEYTEEKPYPEGSYIFFAPFQLLAKLVQHYSGTVQSLPLYNRIGSVFYFALGAIVGCIILVKYIKNKQSVIYYAILITFSLLHIEQSRYGTADPLSFFLLMLIIYTSITWLADVKQKRYIYIYISFLLVGFLAACKYPLIFFSIIPFSAFFLKGFKWSVPNVLRLLLCIVCIAVGFFLISPKAALDHDYISTVCSLELNAYLTHPNLTEAGGFFNHVFSILVYWLLYSDCLLAPLFFAYGIRYFFRSNSAYASSPMLRFFKYVLPISMLIFVVYNIFVTSLFIRTLYPFYCIALFYTSIGLSYMCKRKSALVAIIIAITMLRGISFLCAYSPQNVQEELLSYVEKAEEISHNGRIIGLGTDSYVTGKQANALDCLNKAEVIEIKALREPGGFPSLDSSDIVITGSLEFGIASPYPFPIPTRPAITNLTTGWKEFKSIYKDYYIGQSYPEYYGYLYGFWIKGVCVSEFDFPMNYVYAIP